MNADSQGKHRYRDRLRRPLNSPEFRGARPRKFSSTVEAGMLIERDVAVPTRFGFDLYVDIFRPADQGARVPPLIAWTPYGKHDPAPLATLYPGCGVKAEWMSRYTIFEAPDPLYWVSRGYAVINADIPGNWYATTDAHYLAPQEAEAHYDLIEWAGSQPWSNGKVGLSGVSYLSSSQWSVAALKPPHLAAINPWEGWSDTYNEIVRHGGIPETSFWNHIQVRWGVSDRRVEDLWALTHEHPFFDEYWRSKVANLAAIDVPAFVVASWSDHGVHTRGTLEGFKKMSSREKWLEVHGSKKWGYFYEPSSVARQSMFFDRFLKGVDTGVDKWPRVRLHVRDCYGKARIAAARSWPAEGTEYRSLYLDATRGKMSPSVPAENASVTYDPFDEADGACFDFTFDQPIELVGHMKLCLFVSTDKGDDLDLFVVVEKMRGGKSKVGFAHYGSFEEGPVAFGWLRVSRRALRADLSTPWQPVLANDRDDKISPGQVVETHIEILPSGTRFAAGDALRLIVKGRDIYTYPKPMVYMRHEDSVNRGPHRIHTGPGAASYLLVPVVELPDET
jgi:predicted acyl esterase